MICVRLLLLTEAAVFPELVASRLLSINSEFSRSQTNETEFSFVPSESLFLLFFKLGVKQVFKFQYLVLNSKKYYFLYSRYCRKIVK